ncbi:hypothetical protein VTP01DRAFT_7622, partial [Rhizomucor pusillus]|uniref:uncharacterized protein n=1 Tax=Rhizomucor pusillus TaxID=4840 RepID=UPI0037432AE7
MDLSIFLKELPQSMQVLKRWITHYAGQVPGSRSLDPPKRAFCGGYASASLLQAQRRNHSSKNQQLMMSLQSSPSASDREQCYVRDGKG